MFSIYYNYIPRQVAQFLADGFNFNADPLGTKRDYDKDFFYQSVFVQFHAIVLGRSRDIVAASLLDFDYKCSVVYPNHFIVLEQFRRRGIGSLLLDKIKELSTTVQLECWLENTEAQVFYKRNGFNIMYSTGSNVYMEYKS